MYVQCTDFENLNLKMHIVIPFILIGYFRRMNIIQTTESFVEKLSSDISYPEDILLLITSSFFRRKV